MDATHMRFVLSPTYLQLPKQGDFSDHTVPHELAEAVHAP